MLRAKPSSAKGRYLKKVTFSTTMGPGIPVDPNRTRNLLEDDASRLSRPASTRLHSDEPPASARLHAGSSSLMG